MIKENIGICVRYGEIALKGKNQGKFLNKLIENIKAFLKRKKLDFIKIEILSRRVIIVLNSIDLEKESGLESFFNLIDKFKDLKNVFGITSFSPCVIIDSDYDKIKEVSEQLFAWKFEKNKTFSVDAKRLDKSFKLDSMSLNKTLGGEIATKFDLKVSLKNPDIKISIESMSGKSLVFVDSVKGYGGLPIGSEEKLVSLISAGIDSPVASWMMMKRGCPLVFLTFYSNKEQLKVVEKLVDRLKEYSDGFELKLIALNHKKEIAKYLDCLKKRRLESYNCLLCKKMMLEKAVEIAETENAWGIVTGDSIGQVASQTIENISFVRKGIELPVLSPVIGMDKNEIIGISREIGTFKIFDDNNSKMEKCPFLPSNPATKVTKQKINKLMNLCDNIKNLGE